MPRIIAVSLVTLFAVLFMGGPVTADAQVYLCGGGYNCYQCINNSDSTQTCIIQSGGNMGDCCSIEEWPEGSGHRWCQSPGDPCDWDFALNPVVLTPAGTVVARNTTLRHDGIAVSTCGGYIVAHSRVTTVSGYGEPPDARHALRRVSFADVFARAAATRNHSRAAGGGELRV